MMRRCLFIRLHDDEGEKAMRWKNYDGKRGGTAGGDYHGRED
jgi:hypothetical protein